MRGVPGAPIAAALVVLALPLAACGSGSSELARPSAPAAGAAARTAPDPETASTERPSIVVTYAVLGSLVSDLVGDAAEVTVLMPNGTDPHEWQPSARDVETVNGADIVVENGLALEEGLEDALAEAERAGVRVFRATDHVDVRTIGDGEAVDEDGGEHDPGAPDPHIWTDPLALQAVVAALADTLERDLGLDVAPRAARLEARLEALDGELEEVLAVVPAERRKLVTGHDSMGYFARRYGFELVGALIPSINSQAQASAADLAELKERIEAEGVPIVFTELGTPARIAEAIAAEAGARVVELPSHTLPGDGSYFTFMRELANDVARALA